MGPKDLEECNSIHNESLWIVSEAVKEEEESDNDVEAEGGDAEDGSIEPRIQQTMVETRSWEKSVTSKRRWRYDGMRITIMFRSRDRPHALEAGMEAYINASLERKPSDDREVKQD